MGQPQKESFNVGREYTEVVYIAGRPAQDWSLNEMQAIGHLAQSRLGSNVFEHGGILDGASTYFPDTDEIGITEGSGWFFDRVLRIPATELTYPTAASGIHTVYARILRDQVTAGEDTTLVAPTTGDPVEERIRTRLSLVTSSPDVFNERFERFSAAGVPENWTLVSGECARGYPGKFGESGVLLDHTTGTETRIEATLTLTPATNYTVYFWVRTAEGGVDLVLGNGAFVDLERTSPSWSPSDYGFATSGNYVRKSFSFTSDGNTEPVRLRIIVPSVAPTTQILVDAILVTTSTLGALELERHYVPVLFWDRATDVVTRAVTRASRLQMRDLRPPLDGQDIINIGVNQSLLDFMATIFSDVFGSFRLPKAMTVSRESSIDDATHVGVRVSGGRAYIQGYKVDAAVTLLALNKAQTTAHIEGEGATAFFGTQLYPMAKAVGADGFPIAAVTEVLATIEEVKTVTKGVTDGVDDTGEVNVVTVLGVSQGTQASITGTGTTFTFAGGATNTFKVTVSNYDGTAGAEQTLVFSRGTYTIAEVLEALSRGSGRAYRSGKIVGNILFENDGSGHVRIKTKTRANEADITIGGATSTANSILGFTNDATASGTGTTYVESTDWARSGNAIDWLSGGAEPSEGTTYAVVLRRNAILADGTDYKFGGVFGTQVDRYYKVATISNGVGLVGSAVHRVTPVGSINVVSWPAVPNAASYNVYRSDDGGSTYAFLKHTVDLSFTDDGSMTPDAGVGPSTVSGTTTGSTSPGATTVAIGVNPTSVGFAATGKAYLSGTDEFDYTGTNSTSFTGVTNVGATHGAGSTVTAAPAMSTITLTEGLLGVVNLSPQGLEPVDNTTLTFEYDYYRPRIDSIVVSPSGGIFAIQGTPADRPFPPAVPVGYLQVAQVTVYANSATIVIANEPEIDRLTMRDLQSLSRQQRQSRQTIEEIIILQELDNRVSTAKTGRFADSLASSVQLDPDHALWDGIYYQAQRAVSVPRTRTPLTLVVNSGETTAVQYGGKWYCPSTEVEHVRQDQWSDTIDVNPFESYTVAPAVITLTPATATWTQSASSEELIETEMTALAQRLSQQENVAGVNIQLNGAWVGRALVEQQEDGLLAQSGRDAALATVRSVIQTALSQQSATRRFDMEPIVVTIEGKHYGSLEDNIAATFHGQAVALTGTGGTVAGTNPNTVKADSVGRWKATFTIPAGVLASAADVRAVGGGGSSATATFHFLVGAEVAPFTLDTLLVIDPVAQSDYTDTAMFISAVGLFFTRKSATIPVEVRIHEIIAGVPGGRLLASKTLAPSEVSTTVETKVTFDDYVYIPANTGYTIVVACPRNDYTLQFAKLGSYGRNPQAPITANPYPKGVMFASSNGQSWDIYNESDLRFVVYKRAFSNGQLEFNPVTSVSLSDIWLATQEQIAPGTSIAWEYEINGDGEVIPFSSRQKTALPAVATSIILRGRLVTTSAGVSPSVVSGGLLRLVGFLNDTAGKIVWRMINFSQDLASAKIYVGAHVPNGASITWLVSNDDGVTWDTASQDSSQAIDEYWTEYALSATFSDDTQRQFRLRADLASDSALRPPFASTVGVVLQ